mgnify:CR=1 FL=1
MTLKLYCTCGAYRRGSLPGYLAAVMLRDWEQNHTDEGHAPCDARTAQRARAKAENDWALAERRAEKAI